MRRKVLLAILTAALPVALSGLGTRATAPPAGSSVIRDGEAARFTLTPPAPTTAHPEVIQPDTQIEPSIAVNPANPLNVVTGFQEGRVAGGGDETNGFATTFDGGKTWTHGEVPKLTYNVGGTSGCGPGPCDRASDAVVAFGPDNSVYFSSLTFDDSSQNGLCSSMAINVSRNGGLTWGDPVFFQDDCAGGLNDKNWVVVDNSGASGHHKGRVYVVWDRVDPVLYDYCDSGCDQQTNWAGIQLLPIESTTLGVVSPLQGIGAQPLVLSDGSLGVMYTSLTAAPVTIPGEQPDISPGGSQIEFALAPAAGSIPFPLPLPFTQLSIPVASDQANAIRYQRASDGLPAAAVDPTNGDLYITWDDGRFRSDGVNDIVFTHSSTGGLTWDTVTKVPAQQGAYLDHFNAMVAAGSDGTVHVAYLQRHEDASTNRDLFSPTIDVFYQESHDKGQTWTQPLKTSTQPSYFFYGAFSRNGLFQGDYNEIATGGGYTYIARERAYPLTPGEAHGLTYDSTNNVYTGDTSQCSSSGGVVTNAPACLSHQHQRTWVAVLGAATPGAPPAASTSGASTLPLPDTSAEAGSPLMLALLIAGIATVLGAITIRLRRRRRLGSEKAVPSTNS
jgi:hypothetical protein